MQKKRSVGDGSGVVVVYSGIIYDLFLHWQHHVSAM